MESSVISFRVNKEEANLINRLAQFYGVSPSKAVKMATLEKAENEIDYETGIAALKEHQAHPNTYSSDDFRKEFLA
jgi:uncharacterized protein (DUF1778 family)